MPRVRWALAIDTPARHAAALSIARAPPSGALGTGAHAQVAELRSMKSDVHIQKAAVFEADTNRCDRAALVWPKLQFSISDGASVFAGCT
eukprot:m.306800 g.306800  ORF g.306800 m.306800 type:complete len:90 (-) comp27369_c0_seq4:430-699(-)